MFHISAENVKCIKADHNPTKYKIFHRNTMFNMLNTTVLTDEYQLEQKSQVNNEDITSTMSSVNIINSKHKRKNYYHSNIDLRYSRTPKLNDKDMLYPHTIPVPSEESSPSKTTNDSMFFGTENSTVVTTQVGATALIPCTVHQIGDGVVSINYLYILLFTNLKLSSFEGNALKVLTSGFRIGKLWVILNLIIYLIFKFLKKIVISYF